MKERQVEDQREVNRLYRSKNKLEKALPSGDEGEKASAREKIGNYVVIIVKNCYTKSYELNKNRQKIHQQLAFRLWSERKREYI